MATTSTFREGDKVMWSPSYIANAGKIEKGWPAKRAADVGTVERVTTEGYVVVTWHDGMCCLHPAQRLTCITDINNGKGIDR